MLRVTVEIVPYGMEAHKRVLGTVDIANIRTVDDIADYQVKYQTKTDEIKFFQLKNYNRADGFWKLCYMVLKSISRRK